MEGLNIKEEIPFKIGNWYQLKNELPNYLKFWGIFNIKGYSVSFSAYISN